MKKKQTRIPYDPVNYLRGKVILEKSATEILDARPAISANINAGHSYANIESSGNIKRRKK
jgi:hypothetical protein